MHDIADLLARPTYGMAQVDWILRLRAGTARRWIDGYERRGRAYPPIVRLAMKGEVWVTWGEFTETRLISEFRDSGVPVQHLRPAVERLREEFDRPYPLAHALPYPEAQGRELVMRVREQVGLDEHLRLVVIRNGQLRLSVEADRFVRSVDFSDQEVVQRMHPMPELNHCGRQVPRTAAGDRARRRTGSGGRQGLGDRPARPCRHRAGQADPHEASRACRIPVGWTTRVLDRG